MLAYSGDRKESTKNYYDEDYDYTYDDEPDEGDNVKKSEEIASPLEENAIEAVTYRTTTLRTATYEVTENVVDIPDNSTRTGPVVVNYTTPRPLNTANLPDAVSNITDPPTNSNHYGFVTEPDDGSAKPKKNYFSIFHVKAEYDDKPNVPNVDYNSRPSGFKDYVLGLKQGIINGLYRLFKGKHRHEGSHEHISDQQESYHRYQSEIPYPSRFDHASKHNGDDEYD